MITPPKTPSFVENFKKLVNEKYGRANLKKDNLKNCIEIAKKIINEEF